MGLLLLKRVSGAGSMLLFSAENFLIFFDNWSNWLLFFRLSVFSVNREKSFKWKWRMNFHECSDWIFSWNCVQVRHLNIIVYFQVRAFVGLGPVSTVGHVEGAAKFLSRIEPEFQVSKFITFPFIYPIISSWLLVLWYFIKHLRWSKTSFYFYLNFWFYGQYLIIAELYLKLLHSIGNCRWKRPL